MKSSIQDVLSISAGAQSARRAALQVYLLIALISAVVLAAVAALHTIEMSAALLATLLLIPALASLWLWRARLPDWMLQSGALLFVLFATGYGMSVSGDVAALIVIALVALLVLAVHGSPAMRLVTVVLGVVGLFVTQAVFTPAGNLVALLPVLLCAGLMITASFVVLQRQVGSQLDAQQHADVQLGERERLLSDFRRRNEAFRRMVEKDAEQKAAQLQRANRELRDANSHLESFNYMVSHDIRASLRVLDGLAKVLVEDIHEQRPVEALQNLSRLQTSISQMRNMVQELLNMSQSGNTALRRRKVDLSAIIGELVRDLQIAEPHRRVTVDIAEQMVACVQPDLIREALQNLLGNAWKFTAQQSDARIQFGISNERERIYFVRDNGIGIDMNNAAELFKPFKRLHSDRGYEGTGVGLASVKRIIECHGGRVWAMAEPSGGTTLCFTLGESQQHRCDEVAHAG